MFLFICWQLAVAAGICHTDLTDTLGLHEVFHWKWQVSVYILYSYRFHRHTGLACSVALEVAGICLHFVFIQISQTYWACMKCFIGSGRYLFTFCIHTDFTDTLGLHAVLHWKWQVSVYILYSYRSHRHTGLA